MIDSPIALLALLAAFVAVPLVLRKLRSAAPDGVRVIARTALSKNATVAVIEVADRRLLVGVSEQGVQLLTELDPHLSPDLASHPHPTQLFDDGTDAVDRPTEVAGHPGTNNVPISSWAAFTRPRNGLLDRLRSMTVRTSPESGRPFRVPPHR